MIVEQFSVVDYGFGKLVVKGFIDVEDVFNIRVISRFLDNLESYLSLDITISHLEAVLDSTNYRIKEVVELTEERLKYLQSNLKDFYDTPKYYDIGPYRTISILEYRVQGKKSKKEDYLLTRVREEAKKQLGQPKIIAVQ